MGLTKFPKGVSSFGIPIIGGGSIPTTTGSYFFVGNQHSGVDAPGYGTMEKPFATLDYAIGKCTADKGDVIIVMPGHAENIASAGGITCDVAGVTVVGLGNGGKRPRFSFTAADATFVISADDITFGNIQWEAKYADVATGLDVSAVDSITFNNCWFTESATNLNYVIVIDLATGASNITVDNCVCTCSDAANDSFINGVACSGLTVVDSRIYFTTAQAAACGQIAMSGNSTNTLIRDCYFVSLVDNALHIDLNGDANTGIIANCYFSSLDTAGAVTTAIDATGCHVFECYVAGEADSFGLIGGGTVYNNS
jgi:hypothetical protein